MKVYFVFLLLILSITSCKKEGDHTYYGIVPPAPITGKTYSAAEVTGFKQIAFNAGVGDEGFIKKWRFKEVLVYMVDTSFRYMNDELDFIIRDCNVLTDTNLVLRKTINKSLATLFIYLTDKNTFVNAEPVASAAYQTLSSIGFTYAFWGSDKKIDRAVVFNDMARQTNNTLLDNRYVIRHEMMHALGLLGHVSLPEFSNSCLFNSYNFVTAYSAFDKRIIPLLYNPAIQAGMRDAELNAVIVNL